MPSRRSQIHPQAESAQRRLAQALSEACDADPERADTGELIKIEEVLAIANEAAKEAISVRRRERHSRDVEKRSGMGGSPDPPPGGPPPASGVHRVFTDARGVEWNVFAV